MQTRMTRRCFVLSSCSVSLYTLLPLHFLPSAGGVARAIASEDPTQASNLAAQAISQSKMPAKVLTGIHLPLTPELVPGDRPVIVWADSLEIIGNIQTQGHDLLLTARTVRFTEGSRISTMAPEPTPDYTGAPRAMDGPNAGDDGRKGGDGGHGGNAGDLLIIAQQIEGTIVVLADGQRGGAAQSGGNGRTGALGRAGTVCRNGEKGGTGGRGGGAGTPGNGGNGGRITLVDHDGQAIGQADISVNAGPPGDAAQHGKSAAGGPGGQGGGPQTQRILDERVY